MKNSKLKIAFAIAIGILYFATTVAFFIPSLPRIPLFFAYIFIILLAQYLGTSSMGFMMTVFASMVGFLSMAPSFHATTYDKHALPFVIMALWAGVFFLYMLRQRKKDQIQESQRKSDQFTKESRDLNQEITFYEEKQKELTRHTDQRKLLSTAAQDLGSSFDPEIIQGKLINLAATLFPNRSIEITVGSSPDVVDAHVIHRKQGVIVPNKAMEGPPMLAAPIRSQGSVAGVLRVGGYEGDHFSKEDLRWLEILTSLATLSLDNGVLFSQIQDMALRDNLTGLLTQKAFLDHLENALLESSRYNTSVGLILCDIDHFKNVNDTYGHQVGDSVLQGFAHVLARNVRDIDVVSRYGGEEFVILLLQSDLESSIQIAEKIRMDIEQQRFAARSTVVNVTGSFGVASFPKEATSVQQLLRTADQRLYAAKKNGRNQVIGKAA